jgi:two-component system, chemotaxis family, sensor kinase CheA
MADTSSQQAAAGIDLTQFYRVFFEEAAENLDTFEKMLLEVDIGAADDEELNAIFRCAHSIKGGAATFGFTDVAELTHQMETLLDKLRRHELAPSAAMVDVLLQSGDALRAQLARHQGDGTAPPDTRSLLTTIAALVESRAVGSPAEPPPAPARRHAALAATPGTRRLALTVGPLDDPQLADQLVELFAEITDLGRIEPADGGVATGGMRRFQVTTTSSDNDLIDLFTFHVAREQVRLEPLEPPAAPGAADPGFGFFDEAPGAPGTAPAPAANAGPAAPAAASPAPAVRRDKPATVESSTLRVSVDKIDQLINLVGELVITQAMLAQNGKIADAAASPQLAAGLADLERNTRDLQEAVMSIRMIPMSQVFSRFPRMLRDLAAKLEKKVELVTQGEATELDKGLVEKITDPLTHLVRNSCDHGIETPAERRALGKPEHGTITLIASHQGSSIVIEVRDDGKGLSRAKLLAKARERGIHAPDTMSDAEVWNLIFAPGFSTAEAVTDVSGRGVGMDVVKKNITSLGGTTEIDSAEGYGMTVRVRLPLTLAIMDGMSIGVGGECYILPLSSVVESFQVRPGMVRTMGGSGRVVQVRDEYMPVLDLEQVFGVPRFDFDRAGDIIVVAETESGRVALLVDELLGQQQVVVKNLETNYRRVDNISGATIMGDGRVALILDVGSLVRQSRH